ISISCVIGQCRDDMHNKLPGKALDLLFTIDDYDIEFGRLVERSGVHSEFVSIQIFVIRIGDMSRCSLDVYDSSLISEHLRKKTPSQKIRFISNPNVAKGHRILHNLTPSRRHQKVAHAHSSKDPRTAQYPHVEEGGNAAAMSLLFRSTNRKALYFLSSSEDWMFRTQFGGVCGGGHGPSVLCTIFCRSSHVMRGQQRDFERAPPKNR